MNVFICIINGYSYFPDPLVAATRMQWSLVAEATNYHPTTNTTTLQLPWSYPGFSLP